MKLVFFLVHRYLFNPRFQRLRAVGIVIATVGIFFATMAVLVTLGVLAGSQQVYRKAVLGFSTQLVVYRADGLSSEDQQELSQFLDGVAIQNVYSPYHFFEALISTSEGPRPVIFKGIDPHKFRAVYDMEIVDFAQAPEPGVYVGTDVLTRQPDIIKTQKIQYWGARSQEGGAITGVQSLPVRGTFKCGYYDFDSRFVIMPLSLLGERFYTKNMVSGFEIRLANMREGDKLTGLLKRHFGDQFEVVSWEQLNKSLFEALKLDRTVVFSVAFLVLTIACLNIFGFNFLFFVERKREFLILSALGLSLSQMRRIFAVLSFLLGGVATLAGCLSALGILTWLAREPGLKLDPTVYYVDHLPVVFAVPWFGVFFAGALVLCYLTSALAGRVLLKRHMGANFS